MSLPTSDPTPHIERRRRLLDLLHARGGGVAVLPTAPQARRSRDAEYPYRSDSDFFYLSGFIEPQAWLVLIAGATDRAILFCQENQPEREIWEGRRFGPQAAAAYFGMDEAYDVARLEELLPGLLADQPALYAPLLADPGLDRRLRRALDGAHGKSRGKRQVPQCIVDVRPLLAEMRLIKDPAEIAAMRRAARISAGAHARAMRHVRPGMHEYEIEAELLHEFRRHGAQAPAYQSIVAAGANACVLHYPAGDGVLRSGELLLIDAGCEYDGYAADISRTFPVNGRYTGAQRELYDLTVAAQAAACTATRPGAAFNDAHEAALRVLTQGMIDAGLLQGTLDGALESKAYERFYMHRTGHWLGLDVHDVGEYREAAPAPTAVGAARASAADRPWRLLRPGMVVTIEPGIYVRAADDVPKAFWDIGIRTEDDALVTAEGCELLTRGVPVDAREIEALMRE